MSYEEFVRFTRDTAVYPDAKLGTVRAVMYTTLGLTGEVGELANQVKKIYRDDDGLMSNDRWNKLVDELGDVYWYLARLTEELGVPVDVVLAWNRDKLQKRQEADTVHGDRRDE